jgi:hypothetical protein
VIVVVPIPASSNNPTFFRIHIVGLSNANDDDNDAVIFSLMNGLIIPPHLLSLLITSCVINLHRLLRQQRGRNAFLDCFAYRLLLQKKIRDMKKQEISYGKILNVGNG